MIKEEKYQTYKPSKTIPQQIEYLNKEKRVQYNEMTKEEANDKLLRYNYINVITPFKHRFAKLNEKHEVIKKDGNHIYERDVEFKEYYDLFLSERKKYPTIIVNILDFEIHFKSIMSHYILINFSINNSEDLKYFIDSLKIRLALSDRKYKEKRIKHMYNHLDELKKQIFDYANVYCFFDRMSLGNILTIYICLDYNLQNKIFQELKKYNMVFGVDQVPQFIDKIFCLVSIRNCVMHCNSLEILIRFYNPKTHELRKKTDRKKYMELIKKLSKEKTHG